LKKKIFSILFALVLVLSFSLIPAMPAMANGEGTDVTLTVPDNVYRPAEFVTSSTTTNSGTAYTNVRFNITVDGPVDFTGDRANTFTITKVNGSTETQGVNETFVLVDGDWVGYWGPAEGFELSDPYGPITSTFTTQMCDVTTAPVGNYDVTVELVDLTPDPDVILATATDSFSLSADTLYVGTTEYQYQFTTIQAAIDAAADTGDTINVATGTYNETVTIPSGKDGLEIAAGSDPILDGAGLGDVNGFNIASDNVKIHGFTIQNFLVATQGSTTNMLGWGIITETGTSGGELYDNTITSGSGGIYICASTNYEVYDNNINNITGDWPYHGHGIIVYSCDNDTYGPISGNIIGKLGHPNTISDTDVATPGYFGSGQGIFVGSDNDFDHLVDADGTKVEYNIVSNVTKSKAIQVAGVTNTSTVDVTHNQISGSKLWGLHIMYCGVVNVNNNTFSGMTDFQVVLATYDAAHPENCLTGEELYDIFKHNGNTFDKAAAAVTPAGNAINTSLADGDYRYIQRNIQDAIDDAHSGDSVEVLAGTYTEAVTILPGIDLTIVGAGRDVTTWIAPVDDSSRMHCIKCNLSGYSAGDTTLDISGFTFSIEDNEISTSGIAILINHAEEANLYLDIYDNQFVETTTIPDETANSMLLCHNRYAGRAAGVAPVKIYNNLDDTTGGICMSNTRAFDIYNNVFDGGSDALHIGYGCPTDTTIGDHHIYDNTFMNVSNAYPDGPWPAIFFNYDGSGTGVTFLPSTIENNVFEDNDVAIGYSMDSDITYPDDVIQFNDFAGNAEAISVWGDYATPVHATRNWWGDASGPKQATTNPRGEGDEVSENVDYAPWLTRDFQTVIDDNIAYFGAPVVHLGTGWNLLSTPIALDPACDTWGDYVALGDPDLHIHATTPAYSFNAQTGAFVAFTGTYQLKPCDAIYVRMAEPDIAAILFSPNVSVPSKSVYTGWNLVSLAWLPSNPKGEGLPVIDALASICMVPGSPIGAIGYSQVVSPPMNQEPWICTHVIDSWMGGDNLMRPTKGYWVFMINNGTLAGFTFTPMSLPGEPD